MSTTEDDHPQATAEIRERLNDPTFLPSRVQLFAAFPVDWGWGKLSNPQTVHAWNEYEDAWREHEILTQEFVEALGDHFVTSVQIDGAPVERPAKILEVGAGSGRLTYFLQKYLEKKRLGGLR